MKPLVVITGAGSGIGRATAQAFAARGARLALCDIDFEKIAEVQRELAASVVLIATVDVANREQMQHFFASVLAIDVPTVLINNAGVSVGGTFADTSIEDWDWLMGINLRGVMLGCHYVVPAMIAAKRGGHIVNIASVFGHWGAPMVSAYVASKFAVLGFSQSLRSELAPHGIGVTAMCPGMINTEIVTSGRMVGAAESRRASLAQRFRRGSDPSRAAAAIVSAIEHNQAVRPVGRDGWALYAMSRTVPWLRDRIGERLLRMMSR